MISPRIGRIEPDSKLSLSVIDRNCDCRAMSENDSVNSVRDETASVSGSFDIPDNSSNSLGETESLSGLIENVSLGSNGNGDLDSNCCIETSSICSLEETAAKIESALRKNLKLNNKPSNGTTKPDLNEKGIRHVPNTNSRLDHIY